MESLLGKTLGQYHLIEQIGQGGMATVYKAYQAGLDRYVAVKVLPPYFAHEPNFAKRFTREAQAIARLDHPNILPVYDFGEEQDISYIVMKYVSAGTVHDKLGKAMPPAEAIKIIDQIARALDFAHEQGVLHRDVKPGNILIDDRDWVYLSDFGLAKMMEGSAEKLTGTGVGMGTPAYMSPEQGQGRVVDARTDVYALGVILFEMLTGRVPYEADTPMAVVIMHVINPIPRPQQLNPHIPEAVTQVLLKALAKDREHRFARAGNLATAFRQAVQNLDPMLASMPIPPDPNATEINPAVQQASLPAAKLPSVEAPAFPPPPSPLLVQPAATKQKGIRWLPIVVGLLGLAFGGLCLVVGLFYFLSSQEPPPPTGETQVSNGAISIITETATSIVTSTATDTPLPSNTPDSLLTNTPPPSLATSTPSPLAPSSTPISTFTPTPIPGAPPTAPTLRPVNSVIIDNFESYNDASLVNGFEINRNAGNEGRVSLVGSAHLNQGQQALALEFNISNDSPNHYIGFDRAIPIQDWSTYASLCLWIESDGSNRSLVVQFGESKYKFWKNSISLASLGRGDHCVAIQAEHQIDLRAIGYYGVYVEGPPQGQSVIYIDDIRVEGQVLPAATATPVAPSWTDTGLRPTGRLADIWTALDADRSELGYPIANLEEGSLCARENFEQGYMLWVDRPGDSDLVWAAVIPNPAANKGNKSYKFTEVWPGSPEYWCDEAAANAPLGPKRGFGMLWCIYPDLQSDIGTALDEEVGGPDYPRCEAQLFQGGAIVHNPLDTSYWVFIENGGWYRY